MSTATVRARSFSSLLDMSDDHEHEENNSSSNSTMLPSGWQKQRCSPASCYHGLFRLVASRGDGAIALSLVLALMLVGSTLGFILPASDELHGIYRRISAIIGWTYFCSWSVSFYPQVLLNYRRKTSVGVSFDFLIYNVLAFTCYAAFTCSLYWSKSVQHSYDKRHAGNPNKVQLNDAIFALHAVFMTAVTLGQALYYDWREGRQRPSFSAVVVCWTILGCASVYAVVVAIAQEMRDRDDGILSWLDFLYFLSYVKVGTSILKYVPQVVLNARRRSTKGWTIWNVILDFTGGILSILQLVLDCWNTGDWGGIRGYPVKFAIGFISVSFDVIFAVQHYVLYPQPPSRRGTDAVVHSTTGPSAPLLPPHLRDFTVQGRGSVENGYEA